MAPDMLGGVLPLRDGPCPARAWREKAYAYVLPHPYQCVCFAYIQFSISHSGGVIVCCRPDLPICHQHSHLSRNASQDRRRALRNILYTSIRRHDMGLLVKYNRRRLAYADIGGGHLHIMALLLRSSSPCDD